MKCFENATRLRTQRSLLIEVEDEDKNRPAERGRWQQQQCRREPFDVCKSPGAWGETLRSPEPRLEFDYRLFQIAPRKIVDINSDDHRELVGRRTNGSAILCLASLAVLVTRKALEPLVEGLLSLAALNAFKHLRVMNAEKLKGEATPCTL